MNKDKIPAYTITPIYLLQLPFLNHYECEECGHRRYFWDKKGFIKIGEKKKKLSAMDRLLIKTTSLMVHDISRSMENGMMDSVMCRNFGGEAIIKFRRYGALTSVGKDVRNKKNGGR